MSWLAASLIACELWQAPPPPRPLSDAVQEVVQSLDGAVVQARQGDPGAIEAWAHAHEVFEAEVEPALRLRHDRATVAAVEYRFSRIHLRLTEGGGQADVDAIEARLAELLSVPPRLP